MLKKSLLSTNFPFISQGAFITNYFKVLEANITIVKHPQARLNIKVFNNVRTYYFLSNKIRILFYYAISAQILPPLIKSFLVFPI